MQILIHRIERKFGALLVAVGVLGFGLTFSPLSISTPVFAESIDLEVPVVGQTPTPAPTIEAPVVVPVGATVSEATFKIELVGLEPFSLVEVFANSEPVLIASGFADAKGEFFAEVKLPPNIAPGDHSLTATNTLTDGTKKTVTIVEFTVLPGGKLAESGSTSGGGTSTGGVVNEGPVTEEEEEEFLDSNPRNLSGVFYVGAFQSTATYEAGGIFNPGARISMYINNTYSQSASGTVKFWVTNPLGLMVRESEPYTLKPLASGETRLVSFDLEEIGQWGVYTSHLSFTPDKSVNSGIEIPYLRSGLLLAFSWVATTMAVLGLGAVFRARATSTRSRFQPEVNSQLDGART
jgi:hypothetical protein